MSNTTTELDNLYHQIKNLVSKCGELGTDEKSVVLFRVAYETALDGLGPIGAMHTASRMMTMTLKILDEGVEELVEDDSGQALDCLDTDRLTRH